jgi:hypothetical protein
MTYKFNKDTVGGVIVVTIRLMGTYYFKMVLDTGAAVTTFDINALYFRGYPVGKMLEKRLVETAGGIIEVDVMPTNIISAFGHSVHNMDVQVYDYLAHGIVSSYDGVLGLDFFENTEFRINMKEQTIEVSNN